MGHPEQALSNVGRARARSAEIGGPDGISQVFQVSAYSGEPFTSILARNLLSKDRCREALGDEAVKSGPEVSLVGMTFVLSSARKRLTGTGAGPDWTMPSGKVESIGLKTTRVRSDSGEQIIFSNGELLKSKIRNYSR